ncbi:sulfate transporter family protein [Enterovirga aerilata]|uniref:Sulfate transporter family protein n=1 Tax=Enterovirga aerilata TaxID=2730920 RepID=A0A849I815_9HYPH|nr:sulfate transporter family protein [Enterovirga sp. DB1703]
MLLPSAYAAFRQVLSPELRGLFWRTLGFTLLLIGLLWYGLTQLLAYIVTAHPVSADYPVVNTALVFLAGAGLLVGLFYILPVTSALVAGFFLDEAALAVERTDFPADPPGQPISLGKSIAYGLRFAGLALLVNLAALMLILVPGVNIFAFFAANAYLLSREYFEMAAGRFRPMAEAARLRRENRGTILAAGAILAGLVLIPIVNLLIPLFGIAFMVHLHKRIAARRLPAL